MAALLDVTVNSEMSEEAVRGGDEAAIAVAERGCPANTITSRLGLTAPPATPLLALLVTLRSLRWTSQVMRRWYMNATSHRRVMLASRPF